MLNTSDSQLIWLLVWYYRRYDIFGRVHESYFKHSHNQIFKNYLDVGCFMTTTHSWLYWSMRMIDEDEGGLK